MCNTPNYVIIFQDFTCCASIRSVEGAVLLVLHWHLNYVDSIITLRDRCIRIDKTFRTIQFDIPKGDQIADKDTPKCVHGGSDLSLILEPSDINRDSWLSSIIKYLQYYLIKFP